MLLFKLVSLLLTIVSLDHYASAQPRVSRSFVRGFLVGYAKGLQEGRHSPVVHQVACAFHPVPEPMHEPILNDIIEPFPAPMMHPEPEHHEPGGYSSNNHVTHSSSSQRSGMHLGNEARGNERGGGPHHHEDHHHGDKKAAATNEISVDHLQKLVPPVHIPLTVTALNAIQPRSEESIIVTPGSSISSKAGKKKATSGH